MTSLIINADDCGLSADVNSSIANYIEKGILSSTTIMAKMNDFNGAVRLYEKYSKVFYYPSCWLLFVQVPVLFWIVEWDDDITLSNHYI